jgi:hypothetical protein
MDQTYQFVNSSPSESQNHVNFTPQTSAPERAYVVRNLPQQTQTLVTSTTLQTNSFQNQYQKLLILPKTFFFRPLNDIYHYNINCREIFYSNISSNIADLLNELLISKVQFNENEYTFFYQQHDNRLYEITCRIVSPSWITEQLNKNVHEIIIEQNTEQEILEFTFQRRENIKTHLKQYLNQYLLI